MSFVQKQWFVACAVVLITMVLSPLAVSAQTNTGKCCLTRRVFSVPGSPNIENYSREISCRLVGDTPCDTKKEVEECLGGRESEGGGRVLLDACPQVHVEEQQVACTAYPKCVEILSTDTALQCERLGPQECQAAAPCFWWGSRNKCFSRFDSSLCEELPKNFCGTDTGASPTVCSFAAGRCSKLAEGELAKRYTQEGGLLPPCAYAGNCRELNDVIETAVNYGRQLFKIIGSFAFVFFVIGGITVLTSFGNPERVNKGKMMITASVVGLIIAFGAYFLVTFILDALQVGSSFKP